MRAARSKSSREGSRVADAPNRPAFTPTHPVDGILAYLHPAWQLAAIVLALWTLALGLRLRGLRQRLRWDRRRGLVNRHARAGVIFAAALAAGYAGGPLTLALVRDEAVFGSAHAFFATLTLLLLATGARLGWRLWRGAPAARDRDLHAFCMGLTVFLSIATAMLGLGLLP